MNTVVRRLARQCSWIPAFAGMTVCGRPESLSGTLRLNTLLSLLVHTRLMGIETPRIGGKAMAAESGAAPLFVLSFRHRDELTQLAERGGWQATAARRSDNAEARFVASGAQVALVDARGALAEGREAVRALADPVEANAAALLVLLSRTDEPALDALFVEGATHFLVSPFTEAQLLHALRFAQRGAERAGGRRTARRREEEGGASWTWRPGSQTVELSPALARRAGLGDEAGQRISLMELFRKLDADGRRAARGAVDRLRPFGRRDPRRAPRPPFAGRCGIGGRPHRGDRADRSGRPQHPRRDDR